MLVGSGVKNFLVTGPVDFPGILFLISLKMKSSMSCHAFAQGNTKHFVANLIIGAGEKGICCYQSDGGNGHSNHIFANNTCIYGGNIPAGIYGSFCEGGAGKLQPYHHHVHCTPNTTGNQPGSAAFRTWIQNSTFAASGNTYYPEGGDGQFHLTENASGCVEYDLSLQQVQVLTGEELGSTQGPVPDTAELVAMARRLLQMDHCNRSHIVHVAQATRAQEDRSSALAN